MFPYCSFLSLTVVIDLHVNTDLQILKLII